VSELDEEIRMLDEILEPLVAHSAPELVERLNRPGFGGDSGYWIPTFSLAFASAA
jgi:hypothetical protein